MHDHQELLYGFYPVKCFKAWKLSGYITWSEKLDVHLQWRFAWLNFCINYLQESCLGRTGCASCFCNWCMKMHWKSDDSASLWVITQVKVSSLPIGCRAELGFVATVSLRNSFKKRWHCSQHIIWLSPLMWSVFIELVCSWPVKILCMKRLMCTEESQILAVS